MIGFCELNVPSAKQAHDFGLSNLCAYMPMGRSKGSKETKNKEGKKGLRFFCITDALNDARGMRSKQSVIRLFSSSWDNTDVRDSRLLGYYTLEALISVHS